MKKIKKIKRIIIVFAIIIAILPFNSFNFFVDGGETFDSELNTSEYYYVESPILIDDSDPTKNWTFTLSYYPWCEGLGTYEDPYIISNLKIENATESCITIQNSNAYFIIKNCTLHNSNNAGIELKHTNRGKIINVTISKCEWAIILQESNYNTLSGNTANNNRDCGIYLRDSDYNNISGNNVSNNIVGIYLYYSNYNTLSGNTVMYNRDRGIYLRNSDNNNILRNIAMYNRDTGIFLLECDNNNILGNIAKYNRDYGIYLLECDDNNISGNNASNTKVGIYLHYSNYNTLSGNIAKYNRDTGIYLLECDNNTISENSASNNGVGIYLMECDNNSISENNASNNMGGIYLGNGDNNNIMGNTVNDNEQNGLGYGIYLQNSDNNNISRNTENNSINGIKLLNCDNNSISGNNLSNNLGGIYLYNSDNNNISGNIANSNFYYGISIHYNSNNNNISGNIVNSNFYEGISIEDNSKKNIISGNILEDNGYYGLMISPTDCNQNLIYNNYFFTNLINAIDDSTNNTWNSATIGNYWDDYRGVDINHDNIGDRPYNILGSAGSQDHFPIFYAYPDFAITQYGIDFEPGVGETEVLATITNIGFTFKGNIKISFIEQRPDNTTRNLENKTITYLRRFESKTVSIKWTPRLFHFLIVSIDPENLILESDKSNNVAKRGGGGNSPTIVRVWSDYGNWSDINTVGTFLKPIKIMNTFYAEILDLDGDVDYVEFEINGKLHNGTREGSIWVFEYNMGRLNLILPSLNLLKIKAYDQIKLYSETRTITIKAVEVPSWLTDLTGPIPDEDPEKVPWLEFDAKHLIITIAFYFPYPHKPVNNDATIPNHVVPVVGAEKLESNFRIEACIKFYILSGKVDIFGYGVYKFKILSYKSELSIKLDGDFKDFILVKAEVTTILTIEFPIYGGKPINTDIVTVKVGLAAQIKLIIIAIFKLINDVLQWAELYISISGFLKAYLKTKVDLGWIGASFETNIMSGLEFIIGFNFTTEDIFMHLDVTLRINWKVTWKFLFIKGSIKGKYEFTYNVFSPEELNITTTEEPWNFTEDHTNIMDSRPRVAADAYGNSMMVWTENRFENENLFTDIYYSVWNGTDWGNANSVTFDEQPDFDPALTYDSNSNVMLTWSRITGDLNTLSTEDPFGLLSTQEIVYSIWNGTNWSVPQPITNDSYANGRVVVSAGKNGEILAVWVGDADSNFTTTEDMELYYSKWNGYSWNMKESLTQNNYMDYSVSLTHDSEGNSMVCWICDTDNNRTTNNDRQLLYARWDGYSWSQAGQIINSEENKETPSITFDLNDNALITWVGGDENTTRLYYSSWDKTTGDWSVPEIVHEDSFFIYYPAINIDPNNTAVIVWRGFEDDVTERAYYLAHNATETYFDGELCYAVKDLNIPNANWSEAKYLTSDNKTDWMASAVIIRGYSNDLLLVWDQNGNVTTQVHEINPDLFINSTADIEISENYPHEREFIDVKAYIHNIGDSKAKNIVVELYDGNPDFGGKRVDTRYIEYINYDSEAEVIFQYQVKPGKNELYIKIDPDDDINELNESNNIAFKIIYVLSDLTLNSTDINLSKMNPVEGDEVYIKVIIHNQGGTKAENIEVHFYNGNDSIGSTTIETLNAGESAEVSILWKVTAGLNNITVVIDVNNTILEWNEENNNASIIISILPDLQIISFNLSDDILLFGENITLNGVIENIGATSAHTVKLEFFDGNPYVDGSLLYSQILNLERGQKIPFSYTWIKAPPGNHKIIAIIDFQNTVDEINESNNIAYQEFNVFDLPDLAIYKAEFQYSSEYIILNIPVKNLGNGGISGVEIQIFGGNPQGNGIKIDSQSISHIGAKQTSIVCFKLYYPLKYNYIHIIVDPKDKIKELNETNNHLIIYYSEILEVDAGPDKQVEEGVLVNFSATLYGGMSRDFTFIWDFGDGNTGQENTTSHQYGDNGIYTVNLTVTGPNCFATDQLIVTVLNVAPTVNAGLDKIVNEDDPVNFNGSFEDLGFLDTHTIEWDFGDGFTDSGLLDPTHIYPNKGIYTVTLTITDDDGGIGTDTMIVTVENVVPIAIAGPNKTIFDCENVTLNAEYSLDTPSDIPSLEYLWDFGDGTNGIGIETSHKYSNLGTYLVTLTVRDNDGASDTDTCFVVVQDDDVDPPELFDLIIQPSIFEINITFTAIDFSGICEIRILVNDELIEPFYQFQIDDTYYFSLKNQWLFKKGESEVEVQVFDADNDRVNDSLMAIISGSFKNSLFDMYEYLNWQIEGLKAYIEENLSCRLKQCLNWKLSKAQEYLGEAFTLVEKGEITCALYHDQIAKVFIEITEFKSEIYNRHCQLPEDQIEFIIDTLHAIRNNIVILMGASTGSEQAYDIAYIEVDLLNLSDFIEGEIPCCTGKHLSKKAYYASMILEFAIFQIAMDEDIECILGYTQWKLERVIWKIEWYHNKGRISEDLANYLIDEITRIIETIEQIIIN
ncbi:MAG: NosD domain-containing protein [Promethearchaeota archaeon]